VPTKLLVQENERDSAATLKAMHTVANGLTGRNLDVSGPEWDGSHYLKITNVPGVLSEVTIRNDGSVEWEYMLRHDIQPDAMHLTDVVRGVLGEDIAGDRSVLPAPSRSLTLKGLVGWALQQCGMAVSLDVVCIDEVFCEVYAEVDVTNPARPARGRVRVTDEPALRWECHIADPTRGIPGISLGEVTGTIAGALNGWTRDT
jgi:hypothetical protein